MLAAHRVGEDWEVQTQDTRYQAPNLVIAAGYSREPYMPEWPGQSLFRGAVLHIARYRSGETFKGQSVLVVGFGNSGGEIAIELHERGASVGLSVRGPVNAIRANRSAFRCWRSASPSESSPHAKPMRSTRRCCARPSVI